jgi:hypothetical protein
MSNIIIAAPLVNGDLMPYLEEGESCKAAVQLVTGDDLRPPARSLTITVHTKDGKTVVVTIPNDSVGRAKVRVDGVEI